MKKNTTSKFLVGSWVSFYPFDVDSYEYQLDQMREAGLNFNIFPAVFGGGMHTPELWADVEQQYAKRDMYYCMNGGLNTELMEIGVEYAKGKERCIGYHLVDEPGGAALPHVGEICRAYREADGTRYPFVNLFPSYVGNAVMEGDYYQYCSRFVREAGAENIEYLSHDYYPFHLNGTALGIFGDMEVIRRVAFENGRLRTHGFPQSTAWMGTRMPNIDEMRWNVYAYLAYGFKALSWFNLVCPGKSDTEGECFRESVIYRDGTVKNKQLMKDFGKLNAEVHALGDTLMKLDTVHAYHTKGGIAGVELLPADWMITPVGDEDFVISHMVTQKGDETYVMIFNKSWEKPVTASFRISEYSGIQSIEYISPFNGNSYPANVADGVLTETFRPGEGKLYKLVGKLTIRVYPMNFEKNRLEVDLDAPVSIAGVDIALPLHNAGQAAAIQISTNKRFTENKTSIEIFDEIPQNGRLRFEATVGKYMRLAVSDDDGSAPENGWCEIRLRTAEELERYPEPVEQAEEAVETIHYDDVDFTALEEAIAVFEELKESDYTSESWHAAKNFYDAAVAMKDGTYPQNAVTVAAWKLQDAVRELEPILWVTKRETDENQAAIDSKKKSQKLKIAKGLLPAAIAALAGTFAGVAAGVLRSLRNKKK